MRYWIYEDTNQKVRIHKETYRNYTIRSARNAADWLGPFATLGAAILVTSRRPRMRWDP